MTVLDNQLEDSCTWFAAKPQYQQWLQMSTDSRPKTLWVNGNPGSGKSNLAGHLISNLKERNLNCCYWFFKDGEKHTKSLSTCLRSIAYQLALSNGRVQKEILSMQADDIRFDRDNEASVWRVLFLSGVFRANIAEPVYWIMDALDECQNPEALFPLLSKLTNRLSLHVLITGRKTSDLATLFSSLKPPSLVEEISPLDTLNDIKHYVQTNRSLVQVGNEDFQQFLVNRLVAKSNGCFLWVRLILNEFDNIFSEEEAISVLDEIHSDMDVLYDRILENMSKMPRNKDLVKALLTWVACAVRPLSVSDLEVALKLDTSITTQGNLQRLVSSACGQLLYIDAQARIRMVHETAREFLLDSQLDSEFAINHQKGHQRLTKVCLFFLSSDDMKAPRSRRASQTSRGRELPSFAEYSCVSFAQHLNNSHSGDDTVFSALSSFIDSNALSWVEFIAKRGDLALLIKSAKDMKRFLERRAKYSPPTDPILRLVESWVNDIIKVTTRFSKSLLSSPNSIHWLIPPFCPFQSAIHRKHASAYRGLSVYGFKNDEWDDRIACLEHRGDQALSIACSESFFALGLLSGKIILYDMSSCQPFLDFKQNGAVQILELGLTANILVSCERSSAIVWDITTGDKVHTFHLNDTLITASLSESDTILTVATRGNLLASWDLSNSRLIDNAFWEATTPGDREVIRQAPVHATICPEKKLLAAVYRGKPIVLWDTPGQCMYGVCSKEPTTGPRVIHSAINAITFNPNPKADLLFAAYCDGDLAVFDLENLQLKLLVECEADTLSFSPDGLTLAAGNAFGEIRIFDLLDTTGDSMTLLYQVNTTDSAIQCLAFNDDNSRLFELRGSQCNIWEPQALVRKGMDENQSEVSGNIPPEARVVNLEGVDAPRITAIEITDNQEIILCGKDNGVIDVYETREGSKVKMLFAHARSIPITSLLWGSAKNLLVSADLSSRLVVNDVMCSCHSASDNWTVKATLLDVRIGETINQPILNVTNDRLVVSTAHSERMWCIGDSLDIFSAGIANSSGRWIIDPCSAEHLIRIDQRSIQKYNWSTSKILEMEISEEGSPQDQNGIIRSVFACCKGQMIATQLRTRRRGYYSSSTHLWNAADFSSEGRTQTTVKALPYSNQLSAICAYLIGVMDDELLFIHKDLWICTSDLTRGSRGYYRHFFIPEDWLTGSEEIQCILNKAKDLVFSKGDELAIVSGGLSDSEFVPF